MGFPGNYPMILHLAMGLLSKQTIARIVAELA
jgi:hypothetical protein